MAAHQSKTLSEAETALSNVIEEKNSLQADQRPFLRTPPKTMAQSRRLLTILVVGLLVTFGLATALTPKPWARVPCHDKSPNAKGTTPAPEADESSFEFLLNSVAPDSLHDLLHRYLPDTYRHGVYPSDQSAMEVLHRANAALATSLVRMARRGNTTTTKPPPTTSSTTVVITTTGPSGDAETTTVAQAVTTNTDLPLQTSTTTPSPTQSPTKGSSTSLGGSTVTTSKAGTPGSPDSPGSPDNPTRSLKPVTSTFTSTINGSPTVVVATSYVGVDGDTGTTTQPNGSLQTNAAAHRNLGVVVEAVVGAVIGGAMLL